MGEALTAKLPELSRLVHVGVEVGKVFTGDLVLGRESSVREVTAITVVSAFNWSNGSLLEASLLLVEGEQNSCEVNTLSCPLGEKSEPCSPLGEKSEPCSLR